MTRVFLVHFTFAQLEDKVKALRGEFEKFKAGKMEYLRVEIERMGEGEWEAEQDMTEHMEKVAMLAAERDAARKTAHRQAMEHRAELRRLEQEKDEEAALMYEEEMQTMHEDLETMNTAYRKAEDMHRIALEEEQVRERARVEEVTRAELQASRCPRCTLTRFPVSNLRKQIEIILVNPKL